MKSIFALPRSVPVALSTLCVCAAGILVGILPYLCASAAAQTKPTDPPAEIFGTWEGKSKCAVPDSTCHDEHVIYEITQEKDIAPSNTLKMDGYKLVNGERQFMGTLRCEYHPAKKLLSCTSGGKNFDDWQYTFSAGTLQGTLTIDGGKTLYRKIAVQKNPGH